MTKLFAGAERALLIGCHGGVARAALALLEHSGPGARLRSRLEALFLVDREGSDASTTFPGAVLLPPTAIDSAAALADLVHAYRITQVIDLSSTDTVDCTRTCDDLGADFLCTSVEEWSGAIPVPTDEAIAKLIPPRRPNLRNGNYLVGSGANPGVVNALVFAAMDRFAARLDLEATVEDLDLYAVLITEEDTTYEHGTSYAPGVFPMTWSPEHCLEELFEPRAFAARRGRLVDLGHRPTERLYRARCGDRLIDGMAVPHEETKTLASRLAGVELAFIYRIPEAARRALAVRPDEAPISDWSTHRLFPPTSTDLVGQDRVGVLLCSRTHGELWLGFDTDVKKGLALGTNATQLQVAAGVIAGWSQLGLRSGIHFTEDLDWRRFLDVAVELLGSLVEVHDPAATQLSLTDRACDAERTLPL